MNTLLKGFRRNTGINHWLAAACLGAQLLATSAVADPSTNQSTNEIEVLKKQIQALSQKLDDLEQRQVQQEKQERQDVAAEKPKPAPFITAGETGFSMKSANSNFILNLSGFAQVDGHYYASPVTTSVKDTMTIRRLRAIASGTVYHDFDYYMQVDFGAGNSVTPTNDSLLQDAYVNIHPWKALQLQVGKFKAPVSLEILPLDQYLWFLERGFPTELAINRDVGAELHGDLWNGALTYAAGAFDGIPDGNGNSGSGDIAVSQNDPTAAGRLVTFPFRNTQISALQNFGFGVGSSYGYQGGTTTPTFTTVGRQTFFSYSNTVNQGGQELRIDPQGYYWWGPFCSYWEYAIDTEKYTMPTKGRATYLQNSGWDIDASWYLTGESNIFGVLPKVASPFRFDGSGWGSFQLAARFGQLDLDPAAFPLYAAAGSAQKATSWSVSLNWYLNHNVKAIFEYSQTAFSGGSRLPDTVAAQDEKALLGRLQFGF
jgi:phosphate-selective porin OprO and OprP